MRRFKINEGLDDVNKGIGRLRVNKSNVSDGSHTFGELYDHRTALLLYAMRVTPERAWIAKFHNDGTRHEGYFLAGIGDSEGTQKTYHCKDEWWDKFASSDKIEVYDISPFRWDGHTSDDVLSRLIGGGL